MPHRPAVGFSRTLGLAGATALGGGLATSLAWIAAPLLVETGAAQSLGIWALAAVLLVPLVLARLEAPSVGGAYAGVRGSGLALPFVVGWGLVGGYLTVSALLARALADRIVEVVALSGLDIEPRWLLAPILGLVAINEVLGTRGHGRSMVVLVGLSVLGLCLASLPELNGSASIVASPPVGHRLLPVALVAALLWGVEVLLARRPVMRQPDSTAPRAAVLLWIGAFGVGGLGLHVALGRAAAGESAAGPSTVEWSSQQPLLALTAAFGVLCLVALGQSLAAALRVTHELTHDGFLPAILARYRSPQGVVLLPLVIGVAWVAIAAVVVAPVRLLACSAFTILAVSTLTLWPHARRPRRKVAGRGLALPWHPFVPAVAMATAGFFCLLLRPGYGPVVWVGLGLLYFVVRGRRKAAEQSAISRMVGETDEVDPDVGRVLVAVGTGPGAESLIRVGAAIARHQDDELVVLHVAPMIEQVPFFVSRSSAQGAWTSLDDRVVATLGEEPSCRVRTVVRLAPTIADGILDTVSELGVDLVVLGWTGSDGGEPFASVEPVVERVFPATSRGVAVVHGNLPRTLGDILVASAGGPHAASALAVARALGAEADEVALLNVVTPGRRDVRPLAEGSEAIRQTLDRVALEADDGPSIRERVVHAPTIEEGIAREAGLQDVLLLGASIDRLFGQTVLGGFPTRVAEARRGPTIVVKRPEEVGRFWRRRVWEWVSGALPTLDQTERVQIRARMRQSARADVDYYVLICLAAGIATLGLMQSSAAVVIGAMLVAPLMSPILAMGHALVLGYWRLLRRATSSTFKGIGLAVAVGVLFALLFPSVVPTSEMLARGHPSLLDLLVALVSGAAAAYAVSRSSVAAALPGVAIAAALVPPLCVVGYGLGASELALAGGATLLFTTNLAGIVLSSALVFLLLGVRPVRPSTGHGVWRALVAAMLFLATVAIPLSLETRDASRRYRLDSRVRAAVAQAASLDGFDFQALDIGQDADGVLVELTVLPGDATDQDLVGLRSIRDQLAKKLGRPVRLKVTVLHGSVIEMTAAEETE